jgi:fumarate reductase subunit C
MRHGPYRPVLPGNWWLQTASYRQYMLRELTSAPIGVFAALLTVGLIRLGQGPEAWDGFRQALATPGGVVLLVVILAATVIHSLSWFSLAPSTMPVYIGARRLAGAWIAGAHYLLWAAISLTLILLAGG